MKLKISAKLKREILKENEGARVRIFDLCAVEKWVDKALDARKAAAIYGGVDFYAPLNWDSSAGLPIYRAGRKGGIRIVPAGAWCRIERVNGAWTVVSGGRHK